MTSNFKLHLSDLLFPSFCLGCNQEGVLLCQDCRATLDISEHQYCLCRKDPLRIPLHEKRGKCSRCKESPLSGLFAALPYQEKPLTRKLIHQFKYEPYLKSLAKPLATILIEHLIITHKNTDDIWNNSVLVPIPTHKSRLKERGYNQTEELANVLSQTIHIPLITTALTKIKKTASQKDLSATERQQNIAGAFATQDTEQILGKKIFLVDDVYTTGSTMTECAKVLREAGAKQVWGIAIAREG